MLFTEKQKANPMSLSRCVVIRLCILPFASSSEDDSSKAFNACLQIAEKGGPQSVLLSGGMCLYRVWEGVLRPLSCHFG